MQAKIQNLTLAFSGWLALSIGVMAQPPMEQPVSASLPLQFGFLLGNAAEGSVTLVMPRAIEEQRAETRICTEQVVEIPNDRANRMGSQDGERPAFTTGRHRQGGRQDELRQIPATQAASAVPAVEKPAAPVANEEFLSPSERQMLDMVNRERSKAGVPPLKANRQLTDAARSHAANMARQGTLDHTLQGRTFDQRIDATGYRHGAAGENIFWGASAAQAMTYWMRSPGHRGNILSPAYKEIGVGVGATSSGQQYWTQVFAAPAAPSNSASGAAQPR